MLCSSKHILHTPGIVSSFLIHGSFRSSLGCRYQLYNFSLYSSQGLIFDAFILNSYEVVRVLIREGGYSIFFIKEILHCTCYTFYKHKILNLILIHQDFVLSDRYHSYPYLFFDLFTLVPCWLVLLICPFFFFLLFHSLVSSYFCGPLGWVPWVIRVPPID